MVSRNYVVVFDLDETLGSFSQLYKFWVLTKQYLNKDDLDAKYFYNLIDILPLFLRPNILSLLKKIKKKKIAGICNNVMIYTNNKGPNYWANLIKSYFHYKLRFPLFDQIIKAFKINGKHIELGRTSHSKSLKDFINCTKLQTNTKICFLDDQEHDEMKQDNVLYINIDPYYYNVEYNIMATKFYNKHKTLFSRPINHFINFILLNTNNERLNNLHKSITQKNIDLLLTYHIIKEVNGFFNTKPQLYTKKHKICNKKNITRKN